MGAARWCARSCEKLKAGTAAEREDAVKLLRNLAATNAEHRQAIVVSGLVPAIVSLMRANDRPETQENAAGVLKSLAFNNDSNQALIMDSGATPVLVGLLASEHSAVQEQAASVIRYLGSTRVEHRRELSQEGALPALVAILRQNTTPATREQAAAAVRNLVLRHKGHEDQVVQAGGIGPLVDCLRSDHEMLQEHAAGALRNMVVNNNPSTERQIMACQAVPRLIELLSHGSPGVADQVGGVLMCLVDRMVESLEAGEDADEPERGSMAIMLLAKISEENRRAIMDEGALGPLVALLSSGTAGAKEQAAGALGNLMEDSVDRREALIEAKALPLLVGLLSAEQSVKLRAIAAFALRGVVSGQRSAFERAVIDAGALPPLVAMLQEAVEGLVGVAFEAIDVLICLVAGNAAHRKLVQKAGAILPLIELLSSEERDVHQQAVEALLLLRLDPQAEEEIAVNGMFDVLKRLKAHAKDDDVRASAAKAFKDIGGF